MDKNNLSSHPLADKPEQERRSEIGWEWHEPTAAELREELLAPYRHLAESDHPFAPVARETLDDPEPDAHRTIRRCLVEWPGSTLALVQDVEQDYTPLGRRIWAWAIARRLPYPLRSDRRASLKARDVDVSRLPVDWEPDSLLSGRSDTMLAVYHEAAVRAREALIEVCTANLPESLAADGPYRTHLNKAATRTLDPSWTDSKQSEPPMVNLETGSAKSCTSERTRRELEAFFIAEEERRIREDAGLTPSEEEVWLHRYAGNLKPKEIADLTGRKRGTVDAHLSNARQKLKKVV